MDDPYSHKAKERNRLFFEMLRFAEVLRPKAIVIENVPQILTRDKGFARKAIYQYLQDLGYMVASEVLLASDYGVPQARRRAIFVAVKGSLFDFNSIQKCPPLTVGQALKDMPLGDSLNRHRNHSEDFIKRAEAIPQGGNWKDIPKSLYNGISLGENTHYNRYYRLDSKGFSKTLTTRLDYLHPFENRTITLREGARLQSFPDTFEFYGGTVEIAKQIGNAVPPMMARQIASALFPYLS